MQVNNQESSLLLFLSSGKLEVNDILNGGSDLLMKTQSNH